MSIWIDVLIISAHEFNQSKIVSNFKILLCVFGTTLWIWNSNLDNNWMMEFNNDQLNCFSDLICKSWIFL